MSDYEAGDKVLVRAEVVGCIEGVGVNVELFSKTDQYRAWVREDLICPKGSVVLDLSEFNTSPMTHAELVSDYANETQSDLLAEIARQIEEQTKPARIPEPGLWGVVEADTKGKSGNGEHVNIGAGWLATSDGKVRTWATLIDPTLIREGVS